MSIVVGDELVFIHIIKTGGMSIAKNLKHTFGERARQVSEIPGFEDFYRERDPSAWTVQSNPDHAPARVLRMYLGEGYAKATTFAVVRNPWSLVVSNYRFVRQTPSHPGYARLNGMTFDEFVEAGSRKWSQIDWISESGAVIVDHVLRFENLSHEFRRLMERLNLQGDLERINNTSPVNYRSLYSERSREIISDRFHDDIAAFEYHF